MDLIRLVKKHSALLLPIGITLAAVLLFVPALLAGRGVTSQMEESVSLGSQIESLARKTVPANQYKAEQAYQQEHAEDANTITKLAEQTSERELLVYGIFPEPNETSSAIFINFGKVYRKAVEDMVSGMRAHNCPTEAEIADVTKYGATGGAGAAGSRNEAIIERFCKDRAESTPVYAGPDIFSGYDFWDNYNYVGRDQAIEDCWYAQVAYWIQKDVSDTIAAINKDSSSVSKSPVKRLVSFSFSGAYKGGTTGRQGVSAMADMPRYVSSKTNGLTTAWTDRVSNADIDVVHFTFSVIVSNKAVEPFMKELCSQKTHVFKGWSGQEPPQQFVHNQITILKSTVEQIGRPTSATADRYRYGDDAVVQLNLVCEYVFNKAGLTISGGGGTPKSIKPMLVSEKSSGEEAGGMAPARKTMARPPKTRGSSGGTTKKGGAGGEEEAP